MKRSERTACARDLVFWEGQLEHVDDSDGLINKRIESHKASLGRGPISKRLGAKAIAQARAQFEALASVDEAVEHPVIAERREQAVVMAAAELIAVGTIGTPHLAEVTELPTRETPVTEPLAA